MKLSIIGDSNSCGEWGINEEVFYSDKVVEGVLRTYETIYGIDSYLDDYGHSCFNIGISNNTNIRALIDLEYSLLLRLPRKGARFLRPDYIIWFLTEPLRELRVLNNTDCYYGDNIYVDNVKGIISSSNSLFDMNFSLLEYSFNLAENIYNKSGIPFIIVEGLGETFGLEDKYNFSKYVIKDWIGSIAGVKPPIISSYQTISDVSNFLSSNYINEVSELLNGCELWNSHMRGHKDFPDQFHPNREQHKLLSIELDNILRNVSQVIF